MSNDTSLTHNDPLNPTIGTTQVTAEVIGHTSNQDTPQESRSTLKRKRMETSRVEDLMTEQVESVNRQVNVLEEIRDLMKTRNEIETKKLKILQQLHKLDNFEDEETDESDCAFQVNTIGPFML